MLERRSALAGVLGRGGHDGADGRRRLRLGEVRGWSLVQVAAHPGTMARVEAVLGAVPTTPNEVLSAGGASLFSVAPHQFWIIAPDAAGLESRLREAIPPADGAVTPLSHSRTRLFIEGAPARDVLMKGVPLDFHPDVFRVGHFAQTGLHHTPLLIHRSAADRYELYALRTFALSLWEWLADAALEFGYDVLAS
jgi:sarcosine oxidase subunit gamma